MGFVQEKNKTQTSYADQLKREQHNALINERYQRLLNIENNQFNAATAVNEQAFRNTDTVRASVIAPERPAVHTQTIQPIPAREQTPHVTEYVRTQAPQGLIGAETIERIQTQVEQESVTAYATPVAPVYTQPIAIAPAKTVKPVEESYSLTSAGKAVMAIFAAIVMVMLTLICINTQLINQKNARLEELETRRSELIEQNAEVQRRISEAKSEESIREYALSQGMIQMGQ